MCGRLIDAVEASDDLGEVALALWAARVLGHPEAKRVLARLRSLEPVVKAHPTVEVAWSLAALSVEACEPSDPNLADAVARRLMSSFVPESSLFSHWPSGVKGSRLRSHVSCFADQVYPIQALAYYYATTGDLQAVAAANRCASRICELQGPEGQWWWHYDIRTGLVLEGYPVYAIHQDAMGPMALFALQDACGVDHTGEIELSLSWLADAPEIDGSLIDPQADVIWRKVARRERRKWSRGLQALASRIHPALRMPGIDRIAPPGQVDYECRPYHFGWLLHTWSTKRLSTLAHKPLDVGAGSRG